MHFGRIRWICKITNKLFGKSKVFQMALREVLKWLFHEPVTKEKE